MLDYLLAPALILLVLTGWILVQRVAERFARRHPEFDAPREGKAGGSPDCAGCGSERCERRH